MPRRILEGKVVSSVNEKTVTVLVERRFMHPVYKKYIKKSSKYTAHDENNHFNSGDNISIIECKPLSKTKKWVVMIDGKEGPIVAKTSDVKKEKATPAKAAPKKKKATAEKVKAAPKKAAPKKTAAKSKKVAAKKEEK